MDTGRYNSMTRLIVIYKISLTKCENNIGSTIQYSMIDENTTVVVGNVVEFNGYPYLVAQFFRGVTRIGLFNLDTGASWEYCDEACPEINPQTFQYTLRQLGVPFCTAFTRNGVRVYSSVREYMQKHG